MSAYFGFRVSLVQDILSKGHRPCDVAEALVSEGFSQTCYQEIRLYETMGESWTPPRRDGEMIWNPATQRLDRWPHPAVVVPKPRAAEIRREAAAWVDRLLAAPPLVNDPLPDRPPLTQEE